MKFGHNTPGALGMCLEHSKVNFDHQGAPFTSQHDGGTTYGITKVSIVSVQSFKAVASIVWVWGPKISTVLGLDHHYACWQLEHTHRDKQHSTVSQTCPFPLCMNILLHILSHIKQRKVSKIQVLVDPVLTEVKVHHILCRLPPWNITRTTATRYYEKFIYCETLRHVGMLLTRWLLIQEAVKAVLRLKTYLYVIRRHNITSPLLA